MRSILVATSLTLLTALLAPGAAAANESQSGDNGTCAHYNVLYDSVGVLDGSLADVVVDGASAYSLTSTGGVETHIDWYNAAGVWLTWHDGDDSMTGNTPAAAAFGTICVGAVGGFPDVPAVGATWTYQDGL